MAEAVIDGTRWHTRPDMVISAQHLVDLARNYAPRVTLVGEGLPLTLARQSPDFMTCLPSMSGHGAIDNFAVA
jgi:hypothetical protein